MENKILYANNFNNALSFYEEKNEEYIWEIHTIVEYNYNGNGTYYMEIYSSEYQNKLNVNQWTFEKVLVKYDWGGPSLDLFITDSVGCETKIHLADYSTWKSVPKDYEKYWISKAYLKFLEISNFSSCSEFQLSETDLTPMSFEEAINWYKNVMTFKERLSPKVKKELELKFLNYLERWYKMEEPAKEV